MLRAPTGSLPRRMAEVANKGDVKLGVFRLVADILKEQQSERDISSFDSKKSIKNWVRMQATKEWLKGAKASPRLGETYRDVVSLEMHGYLKFDFKGRQVLTKLRIDDLELGAASFRGKAVPLPNCQLCGVEPETREHFLLKCRSLDEVRIKHKGTLEITWGLSRNDAWRMLILAIPKGASEDERRARDVGALAHDLWTRRVRTLGLSENFFLR